MVKKKKKEKKKKWSGRRGRGGPFRPWFPLTVCSWRSKNNNVKQTVKEIKTNRITNAAREREGSNRN